MELENIMLSEVSQVQKDNGCMFFSYVEDRSNTDTSIIIHICKYVQNMFPKVGFLKETRG
jgi:hypothetical protein